VSQSIRQSIDQSDSINQSINQSTNHAFTERLTRRSMHEPERTGTPYRQFLERRNAIPELMETPQAATAFRLELDTARLTRLQVYRF